MTMTPNDGLEDDVTLSKAELEKMAADAMAAMGEVSLEDGTYVAFMLRDGAVRVTGQTLATILTLCEHYLKSGPPLAIEPVRILESKCMAITREWLQEIADATTAEPAAEAEPPEAVPAPGLGLPPAPEVAL